MTQLKNGLHQVLSLGRTFAVYDQSFLDQVRHSHIHLLTEGTKMAVSNSKMPCL